MSRKRPYFVKFQGKDRIVDAISIADASKHVLKPELDKVRKQLDGVRPASASDVAEFARGGGKIETAGVYPEPEKTGELLESLKDGALQSLSDETVSQLAERPETHEGGDKVDVPEDEGEGK